jgi:hypothetical protein
MTQWEQGNMSGNEPRISASETLAYIPQTVHDEKIANALRSKRAWLLGIMTLLLVSGLMTYFLIGAVSVRGLPLILVIALWGAVISGFIHLYDVAKLLHVERLRYLTDFFKRWQVLEMGVVPSDIIDMFCEPDLEFTDPTGAEMLLFIEWHSKNRRRIASEQKRLSTYL